MFDIICVDFLSNKNCITLYFDLVTIHIKTLIYKRVGESNLGPNTDTLTINGLIFYDTLFVFKNYNILILYDYRYYYDFKILFNLLIT